MLVSFELNSVIEHNITCLSLILAFRFWVLRRMGFREIVVKESINF